MLRLYKIYKIYEIYEIKDLKIICELLLLFNVFSSDFISREEIES